MPELCVYALASRRAGRITARGVAGEPLHAIPVGRIDAIVGRVRAVPQPTDQNLRRFDRLMSALWRRTPALLPARFGTTARDMAELDAMIRGREASLRRSLTAVRNRAQMTVRIVVGETVRETVEETIVGRTLSGPPGEPDKARPTGEHKPDNARSTGEHKPDKARPTGTEKQSGTQYLRSRQRAQAVPAFDPLRASVRRWVRDERMERRAGVASIYHLIPSGSVDRYRAALERAARGEGVRLIVSGPWPPYAFAGTW